MHIYIKKLITIYCCFVRLGKCLSLMFVTFLFAVLLVLKMPQNCCVPLCSNVKGGILFPRAEKSPERRQKWIVAIKRIDPNTKKLWEPSRYSVVCADHFLPTYFRETLLGTHILTVTPLMFGCLLI